MAQPVLFNPSWTRTGTAVDSKSQDTRSLPRVQRTYGMEKKQSSFQTHNASIAASAVRQPGATHKVGNAVQVTAHGQENDGPFGVGEALRIQEEGQDGQGGGEEAQHGPHGHPRIREHFGSSAVQPAVVATLQGAALGLLYPGVLVRGRTQGLALLLVGRVPDGRVGQVLVSWTLHAHVVVVILGWEEAAVQFLCSTH